MDNFGKTETFKMDDLEFLEKKKKELAEQQVEIDRQIEAAKAKQEQDRQANLVGLLSRVSSMIKTTGSSFSDVSMGEVIERLDEPLCSEAYSRTIDVEISGRGFDGESVYDMNLDLLKSYEDTTLVISYLVPFDLIKDDPFFK